ncbi:MAG: TonB-dependent receptor [Erythrobacter sp.]
MTRKFAVYAAGLMASSVLAQPVFAQDTDTDTEAADRDNVIIVTATRRAQDVQDIPLAVTAVGPEQLARQGVDNITEVTQVAPSFSSSTAQIASGSVVLRVRGVGTTSNNIGFESAVGIFIDGAYQSRPGIALSEFVDIERVEVLRGPQGTLFGRNTSAGALNITTVRPDVSEFGGFANASYGNFDEISLQGAVNVPIVQDTLGLRVTGAYRQRDGFLTALDADGNAFDDFNDTDQYLVRGQLGWDTEGGVRGRLIFDFANSQSSCCGALEVFQTPLESAGLLGAVGLGARGGITQPNTGTSPFDTPGFAAATNDRLASVNFVPVVDADNWGVTGELEFPISDSADLIFIGSYRDFSSNEFYDSDFSAIDVFNVALDTDIETFTAELRLQGEAWGGRLNYLIGGYFSDEQIRAENTFLLGEDFGELAGALFAGATGGATLDPTSPLFFGANPLTAVTGFDPAGTASTNLFTQSAQSWSIFTHNSLEITDGLEFTVGLRWSDESKSGGFEQLANNNQVCPGVVDGVTGGAIPAAFAPTFIALGCFGFTSPADLPEAAVLPLVQTFQDEFSDEELIYTVKLGYEFAAPINVYASFTHGYKAGGINLDTTAGVAGADPTFLSEEVDAFEIGLKARLLDDAVTLNIAGFHEEFSNFQVLEFTGAAFQTFNVPEAISTGIEIESVIRPNEHWTFNLATTILDARYPDDCAGDLQSITVISLCGNDLTNAANVVGIAGFLYENDLSDSLEFFFAGQVRLESDQRTSTQAIVPPSQADVDALGGDIQAAVDAAPLIIADEQDGNIQVNLRAGIGSTNESWRIEAFVNNLTDVVTRGVTFNNVLRGTGATNARSAFTLAPRTYGVAVKTKF